MRRRMLFLGVIASTVMSAEANQNFTCPQTATVTETTQNVPKDWRVGHDEFPTRLYYVSMSFTNGHDSRADYEQKIAGNRTKYTWDLNAVMKREPWFVRCAYEQTNILLLIPVPAAMKFCSTTQKNAPNRDVESVMHCR
jgi:hypothetical protein